jgi:hypothetical protein
VGALAEELNTGDQDQRERGDEEGKETQEKDQIRTHDRARLRAKKKPRHLAMRGFNFGSSTWAPWVRWIANPTVQALLERH